MADNALLKAPSRKIFAPLFRSRWQNMQNIVNDTVFFALAPSAYITYYQAFIRQWEQWATGFVLQLHHSDFFSTGMGYTVCDIFTKECMSGSFRLQSKDEETKQFINEWGENILDEVFNQMFFFANAVGNAILVLTPVDNELYPTVYPVSRVFFQIGKRGDITSAIILNRFVAGDKAYYTREHRTMMNGVPYWKIDLVEGTLVTCPTWTGMGIKKIPDCIREQWNRQYGAGFEVAKWYRMPERMKNIGCYNVRNKSVAVAISDLAGYSDSTLHTALDILYAIDYNYTQGQVDQYLGKSIALIPKHFERTAINVNQPGSLSDGMTFREALDYQSAPLDNEFFTQVPDDNLNGEPIKPMFIQPDLRGEARKHIRDSDLELLASKVGLSCSTLASHLATNSSGAKTDDEINSENSVTEKSVGNKRQLASVAINRMLTDVAHFYGYEYNVQIEWGRSATNSARENAELLADYQAGTLSLRDYLRKRWTDLTEEDIEKKATELEQEAQKRQQQQYGYGGYNDKDYFGDQAEGVNDGDDTSATDNGGKTA